MSSAITSSGAAGDGTRSQPLLDPVGVGAILVGFAILAIGVRALGSGHPYDFGFYYRGAAAAWEHGDPTVVDGWLGTPFMANQLEIPLKNAEAELNFMAYNLRRMPQIFMTDQF